MRLNQAEPIKSDLQIQDQTRSSLICSTYCQLQSAAPLDRMAGWFGESAPRTSRMFGQNSVALAIPASRSRGPSGKRGGPFVRMVGHSYNASDLVGSSVAWDEGRDCFRYLTITPSTRPPSSATGARRLTCAVLAPRRNGTFLLCQEGDISTLALTGLQTRGDFKAYL
jgi:hypothetical protein